MQYIYLKNPWRWREKSYQIDGKNGFNALTASMLTDWHEMTCRYKWKRTLCMKW